jgi:hypothetical protein
MRRRRLILLIAVPVVLIAVYTAAWFVFASVLRGEIDTAIARFEADGGEVTHDGLDIGGYPFSLAAEAGDVTIRQPDGLTATIGALSGRAAVWAPTDVALALGDGLVVTVPTAPRLPPTVITAASGTGAVDARMAGGFNAVRVSLFDVAVEPGRQPATRIDRLDTTLTQPDPAEPLRVTAEATGIGLPEVPLVGFSDTVDRIAADVILSGPLPPAAYAPMVAAWRDAGGELRVERAELDWGALSARADGVITLDRELQPEGRLTARVQGFDSVVTALEQAGLVGGNQSVLVRLGLGIFSMQPDEDGVPTLVQPLSIADRRVSLGPFPLPGRLPYIRWPDPPAAVVF